MREFQGPEHQLDHRHLTVVLAACAIHSSDPALPSVINAGVGHQEVLRLLNPYHLIIEQYFDGLAGEPVIHIQAKVVEPNLALQAHLAGQLAEAEDPPEACRFDRAAAGAPQDDGSARDAPA